MSLLLSRLLDAKLSVDCMLSSFFALADPCLLGLLLSFPARELYVRSTSFVAYGFLAGPGGTELLVLTLASDSFLAQSSSFFVIDLAAWAALSLSSLRSYFNY